jgi:hypothetical protein
MGNSIPRCNTDTDHCLGHIAHNKCKHTINGALVGSQTSSIQSYAEVAIPSNSKTSHSHLHSHSHSHTLSPIDRGFSSPVCSPKPPTHFTKPIGLPTSYSMSPTIASSYGSYYAHASGQEPAGSARDADSSNGRKRSRDLDSPGFMMLEQETSPAGKRLKQYDEQVRDYGCTYPSETDRGDPVKQLLCEWTTVFTL